MIEFIASNIARMDLKCLHETSDYHHTISTVVKMCLHFSEELGMLPPIKEEYSDKVTGYSLRHAFLQPHDESVQQLFKWDDE